MCALTRVRAHTLIHSKEMVMNNPHVCIAQVQTHRHRYRHQTPRKPAKMAARIDFCRG